MSNLNTRNQGQIDDILDYLFREGPVEDMTKKAQLNLRASLTDAAESAIFYGSSNHTTTGILFVAMRSNGVVAINFGIEENSFVNQIEDQFDAPIYFEPEKTEVAIQQIQSYLDGNRNTFDLPTDISILTDFQQQVLKTTQQIPRGKIVTYLDIARKIGKPKAARAVGQALGRNPIPIVIPCHRVIASDGSLGGYSGGGGLETKAKLLKLEGALAV